MKKSPFSPFLTFRTIVESIRSAESMGDWGTNPPPATNAIIELRGIWIFDCGLKWSNKVKNTRAKAVHVTALCYLVRS
jgi:hypothetical protein